MRLDRERQELRVCSDPQLEPIEKEFSLNTHGTSQFFEVDAHHPTAIRGLLKQPEFEVTRLVMKTIRGKEFIVGVQGKIPVSCLHIGAARRRKTLSAVFGRRTTHISGSKCMPATQFKGEQPGNTGEPTEEQACADQGDA